MTKTEIDIDAIEVMYNLLPKNERRSFLIKKGGMLITDVRTVSEQFFTVEYSNFIFTIEESFRTSYKLNEDRKHFSDMVHRVQLILEDRIKDGKGTFRQIIRR